jgi:superfamily II DNA or RNA helicase
MSNQMKRAERSELGAVIDEVRAWIETARVCRHLAAHMPLAGPIILGEASVLGLFEQAAASQDLETAAPLCRTILFDGRKRLQPAREAADRLVKFHSGTSAAKGGEALAKLHAGLTARASLETGHLRQVLSDLERMRTDAANTLDNVAHMPISRVDVLDDTEIAAMQSLIQIVDLHEAEAERQLEPSTCSSGTCQDLHSSAVLLGRFHSEAVASGTPERMRTLDASVATRLKIEQGQIKVLFEQVLRWEERTNEVRRLRESAHASIKSRTSKALRAAVAIRLGSITIQLAPLHADDTVLLQNLTMVRDAPLSPADEKLLTSGVDAAVTFIPAVKRAFNEEWQCSRDGNCVSAHEIAPGLFAEAETFEKELRRLEAPPVTSSADLDALLDPALGFQSYLSPSPSAPQLISGLLIERAKIGVTTILNAERASEDAGVAAKTAGETVRAADIEDALRAMSLEILKKASPDPIRVAALAKANLNNVWQVLKYDEKYYLDGLDGLGELSARSITQAALRLFEGVREETPVRIDVKRKGAQTEALLSALRSWDAIRRFTPTAKELVLAAGLNELFREKPAPTHVLALVADSTPTAAPRVVTLLKNALKRSTQMSETTDVWTDFLSRPADYFGLLTELGFITEDEKKMHGDLPQEIVEAVRAKELKREYLKASLRTYQGFAARFALVQEKVVIGDEMGLGKTVEALAVLAHLRATGHSHFLVVCPAAVVSNWLKETRKHTDLRVARLHGPLWERNYEANSWVRNGGVAVTTYDLLTWNREHMAKADVACVIFDEAHLIKNPQAKRSQAAAGIIDSVRYAVLLTGTPLENNVQEFRNLVGYVRPELAMAAPEYIPSKFRKHVAPAYLRRNLEDVLSELPELVEVDEWMGMSATDEQAYRHAVQDGKFMLMRRAAMLSGSSNKVQRLIELVEEAEANGRRTIVFSYFREVLTEVAQVLPGRVFGPLTGSTPAKDRQSIVDAFSKAGDGAVLVAQITAGGVGLNIQAASVVVICEPQIKPTMESQAIARAYRMNQTKSVQVHRLLSENSVDERIREILAQKRQIFDDFARESVLARQAPEAVDALQPAHCRGNELPSTGQPVGKVGAGG